MSLRNQLEQSGGWLFRHRSYLPLALVPLALSCLPSFHYLDGSAASSDFWQAGCMVVSLFGLALRVITVGHAPIGTSGRNSHGQVAQTLTTSGVYSVMRHPLYVANFLIVLGFVMSVRIWWLVLLTTCLYVLYYERIILAEEAFLRGRFGEVFERWAAATPAVIPRWRAWRSAEVSFSWRTVLEREYNAFFLIATVFFLIDVIADSYVEQHLKIEPEWLAVFIGGLLVFAVLRTIKKCTSLLRVEGR